MSRHERTVKISSKGQITLPKAARDALGTDIVRVIVDEKSRVRVEAMPELAGSLSKYAKRYIPIEEAREIAWAEVAKERVRRGPAKRR